jgi:MinD-like ATPase involved in chromosome partitioning or flagellar assembly
LADELPGHPPAPAGNGKKVPSGPVEPGPVEPGLAEAGPPDLVEGDGNEQQPPFASHEVTGPAEESLIDEELPDENLGGRDLTDQDLTDQDLGEEGWGEEAALEPAADYDPPPRRGPALLQRFGAPEPGESLPPYQPPASGGPAGTAPSLPASDPYDAEYGAEPYAPPVGYPTGDDYDQPDFFPPDPYLSGQSYYPPDSYGTAESYGQADLYGSADPYSQPEIYSPHPPFPPLPGAPNSPDREGGARPVSSPPFPPAPDPDLLSGAPPAARPRAGDPRAAEPWTFDPWAADLRSASPGTAALTGPGRQAAPDLPPAQDRATSRGRRGTRARGSQAATGQSAVRQSAVGQTGQAGQAEVGQVAVGQARAGQAPVLPVVPGPGRLPDTTESLTPEFLLPSRRRAPSPGWRRLLFQVSGGLVRVPASAAELRRREMISRARTPVAGGHHRVAVLSLKGGVGKTTTAVGLGATLASLRGDRVIAVDGNPDRGTLSDKVRLETSATVRDLLNERGQIERYADVRAFTSQAASRLEVLASDRDPTVSVAFSEADYCEVSRVLEHYYSICITDCGTGLLHSAMAGILRLADQIVLVSSPSVDGARSASATLDWLAAHSYGDLVQNAVVVLSIIRPSSNSTVDLDRLEQHFAARCRAVTRIPYDGHLEEGAEVELDQLSRPAADAYLALAALVGDGLAAPHRD